MDNRQRRGWNDPEGHTGVRALSCGERIKGYSERTSPHPSPLWQPPKEDPHHSRDFTRGCPTSSTRKAYARIGRYEEVFSAERPLVKQMRCSKTMAISFNEEDSRGLLYPRNFALVVIMLVANYTT